MAECFDCGKALSAKARRCSCGWINTGNQKQVISDHRCQYTASQRRCPLPGTMSTNTHAGGPWYCSGHWRTLGDHTKAEAVLIDAEKNYQEILQARRDWRDKLF